MKTCPYCAEDIKDAAIVCRFCGRDLPTAEPATAVTEPSLSQVGKTVEFGGRTGCAYCARTVDAGDEQCRHCRRPLTWDVAELNGDKVATQLRSSVSPDPASYDGLPTAVPPSQGSALPRFAAVAAGVVAAIALGQAFCGGPPPQAYAACGRWIELQLQAAALMGAGRDSTEVMRELDGAESYVKSLPNQRAVLDVCDAILAARTLR